MISFEPVSFDEWRYHFFRVQDEDGIERHMRWEHTPVFQSYYGSVQYYGRDIFSKVLVMPICMRVNDKKVAWTCPYNISDTAIRMRGTYCLPEERGKGYAREIIDHSISIWPLPWTKCIIWTWANNVGFYERCGFKLMENYVPRKPNFKVDRLVAASKDKETWVMCKEMNKGK